MPKKRLLFLLLASFIFIGGCIIQLDKESIQQSDIKSQEKPEIENVIDDEIDITQTKGLGKLCSSLVECFIYCKNSVGRCTDFCNKNPAHELCKVPTAAKSQPWVTDAVTQPLPEGASSVRLILPAQLDNIFLDGIGAYGAHPGGHAEGLDHEWITIKDTVPVRSWADGKVVYVNTIENRIQDDTPNIVIYYGDGLWGEHMHVQKSLVKPGDIVKAGDPVGYGEVYSHSPGYHSAEFNVADQHRRDGVGYWYKFVKGATLVSPFDYLQEDVKKELVEKFTQEVIERHLTRSEAVFGVTPTPWEPYLTNPILFHRNYPGRLEGEWFLRSVPWGFDGIPDIFIFFPPQTKYYQKQRFFQVDESSQYDQVKPLLSGDWEADYQNNRLIITAYGATYYGIFELDESKQQARLKIEYQQGSYPTGFSEQALVYTEREPISKGEERHYWEHPEDDPRNW